MALTYNYSHFTSVHFLKRKYEALLTFKVFKQMIENLIEKKIKCLKINCGEGVYVTIFYLFNRSPIRLNSSITPYEKISSTKPNLSHLRTFGCRTFVYIDKVNRRGKLDSKSIECIHLGYNLETKGDRLYNPIIKKIFID
jgi:hypothetical protein